MSDNTWSLSIVAIIALSILALCAICEHSRIKESSKAMERGYIRTMLPGSTSPVWTKP